ncbi:orotidine-5'-phosphate decarboxylase, partial [bacterium]
MLHKVICALDTGDLAKAEATVRRLSGKVGAFKVGHGLTLNHGLDAIDRLQDAGAGRIFLDLKFHDIPNSVALAVREAAKRRVWMMTVHITGGRAMLEAAMAEACSHAVGDCPLIVGVGVLTSIDETMLRQEIGVPRTVEEQIVALAELAERCDLDGMVCSPQEVAAVRRVLGHDRAVVVPGIRLGGAIVPQHAP